MKIFTLVTVSILAALYSLSCTQKKLQIKLIPRNTHAAVTPEPRYDQWWTTRHNGILERVKKGNVDMIMVGDSITQGWENDGKEVWEKSYSKCNALNLGFGGDSTQHVLWRLSNGEIDGISPKLAIVLVGTNNVSDSSKETSEGIIAVVQKLRQALPKTKILLLAIFPHTEMPENPRRAKNAQASELASVVADNKWVYYLDINKAFLDANGVLSKDVMPDFLHPNANGYNIWAQAMKSKLNQFINCN
ncbi:MAG: hypothetical protein A2Y12_06750 [Planctomycetes bacterium GWF2_42_9]|nr:MAG: hypothetical protein A2Y12_06750 [Planctomycetes bacterium GWF2_42_9]